MKKTQSLKLMLLGLFAAVSTGAWAQFTAEKGVVYDISGAKAKVVGVLANLPDGEFGDGRYLAGTKSIQIEDVIAGKKVDALDKNWKNAGSFATTPQQGQAGTNQDPADPNLNDGSQWVVTPGTNGTAPTGQSVYTTVDATQISAVELVFRASEITEISYDDIKGLHVAGFILGGTSGITVIPDDLFAPVKYVTEIPNEAKQKEIDRLTDLINGSTQYYAPKGIFGSQQVYESNNVPGFYFVIKSERQDNVNGEFVNGAFQISQEEGKAPTVAENLYVWVRIDPETGNLIAADGTGWQTNYAHPVTTDLFPYGVKGLKTIAQEKSDAYAKYEGQAPNQTLVSGALYDYEQAKKATIQAAAAVADETYGYDADKVIASTKAQALIDAINAFKTTNATRWGFLQTHIANDLLNNVTLPDEWYVAFVLATIDDWATEMPSLDDQDKGYVGNKTAGLVKNFIDAYVAYYGFAPQDLQKTEVQAYKFTSYAAAGNIFTENLPATSENVHQLATGMVEDRSTDTADPDAIVQVGDANPKYYYKVKVLQNSVAGFTGNAYYVQLPEDKSIVTDTYYVLYTAEYESGQSNPTMKPVTFQTNVVTSPATEAQTVQLTAAWNADTKVLTFYTGETARGTLNYSTSNKLGETTRVKVGDQYIAVTRVFVVTAEGNDWNGRYYVDADGKLYKQTTTGANWITEGNIQYLPAEASMWTIPGTAEVTSNETATLVVKINPTPETYEYTLSPKDQKPSIDAADPRPELATKVITYPSETERLNTYNTAVADEATKKQAAADAKTAMETANTNLKNAEDALANVKENKDGNWPNTLTGYVYDKDGKNEDLYKAAFNNDIVSVGDHAFAQCVNAKFDGTFRKQLKKIGTEAFLNTLFENLDLSQTGQIDWRGDVDDEGNDIPDGKIDIQDRLNYDRLNPDIQDDAFTGTPLKTMLLATTNVGDGWVKNVVRSIKFEDDVEYTNACGDKYTRDGLNLTLTTVTLPTSDANVEADELEFDWIQEQTFMNCVALTAITIPEQVYQIANQAFSGCEALATITFAATDSQLEYIGEYAFNGTKAGTIDLSAQKKLGIVRVPPFLARGIGAYAFANMPELTTVKLENTALTTLPATVFQNDAKLATVTFFDASAQKPEETTAITSLPTGLFETNAIVNLDLSKTHITTLYPLFNARPDQYKVYDCDGNEIGTADYINRTLTTFTLPENLVTIQPFALSSLQGLVYSKANPFIIPGSVQTMGQGAFMNDANLVAVKAMDSELTALPNSAFAQCLSLEEVTLVTFATLTPGFFGDKAFFSTKTPDVYVNNDTYQLLGENFFEGSYAQLKPYASVINTIQLGNLYYKPWSSKYGTWIEATEHVGVYTAYQNGDKISLYPAKKSTFVKDGVRKDYYKIAAYDKDAVFYANASGAPTTSTSGTYMGAPAQIDRLMSARMTFNRKGMFGEDTPYEYIDGVPVMSTIYYSDNFSSEVLEKTWLALGTAIIVSDQPDAVPYIQKTNEWQKYQSTLDLANQLCVAKEDIPAETNTNFYYLAEQGGKAMYIHHSDATAVPFIPEDAVIFMKDPDYGHMGLAREFEIEIISENDATAINGVVERSLNDSEAIFNVQGIRVIAPVKGQMYIQGGKKFIQK